MAVALLGLTVLVAALPGAAALPSGCGLLANSLPGSWNPSDPFPGLGPGISRNVTNGQVVALFDQVCQQPSFERLAQSQAASNFSLGAEGNTRTGELALTFAFNWVGACSNSTTPGPCQDQAYWLAWPANNTTAGPFQTSHEGVFCACPAVLAPPPFGQPLPWIVLGVVGAVAIAGIVAMVVVVGRRRGRGPPPPVPGALETPVAPAARSPPSDSARTARP